MKEIDIFYKMACYPINIVCFTLVHLDGWIVCVSNSWNVLQLVLCCLLLLNFFLNCFSLGGVGVRGDPQDPGGPGGNWSQKKVAGRAGA